MTETGLIGNISKITNIFQIHLSISDINGKYTLHLDGRYILMAEAISMIIYL